MIRVVGLGLIVACLGSGLWAAEGDLEARRVRDAADGILRQPRYQGFEHFTRTPTQGAADAVPSTATDTTTSGDGAAVTEAGTTGGESRPRSWWERIRESRERDSTESKQPSTQPAPAGEPSTQERDTPRNSAETEPRRQGESAEPPSTNTQPTTPARPPASPAAPPALRGRDGIERPVRFVPRPSASQGEPWDWDWDWNWGLGDWFAGIGPTLVYVVTLVAYSALVIMVVLIVVLVIRALTEHWGPWGASRRLAHAAAVPLADDHSPGEIAADLYRQRALGFAAARDYRAALGQLVLGAMSAIERANWIRYRRGLTLYDYLRSVRTRPAQRSGWQTIAGAYEPVEYGRRQATPESFERALAGYEASFLSTNAASAPTAHDPDTFDAP